MLLCYGEHRDHSTGQEESFKGTSAVRDDLQPSLHVFPFFPSVYSLISLPKDLKPWKNNILINWAQVIAGPSDLRQKGGRPDFCERQFPKRKSGEMDVGQTVLTKPIEKKQSFVEKKGISAVTLSFGTNSKCGYTSYCSRMNKKGEYTWTYK